MLTGMMIIPLSLSLHIVVFIMSVRIEYNNILYYYRINEYLIVYIPSYLMDAVT